MVESSVGGGEEPADVGAEDQGTCGAGMVAKGPGGRAPVQWAAVEHGDITLYSISAVDLITLL